MEIVKIKYKIKTATTKEIFSHLKKCDKDFSPPLSERVNIKEYSEKIFKKSVTFEAWKEELLIGLVATYFNDNYENFAFVTNVSVLRDFMGLGIASELLNKCIEYAIKESFSEIRLFVGKDNNQAIGLYQKFGFTIDGFDAGFLKMKIEQPFKYHRIITVVCKQVSKDLG